MIRKKNILFFTICVMSKLNATNGFMDFFSSQASQLYKNSSQFSSFFPLSEGNSQPFKTPYASKQYDDSAMPISQQNQASSPLQNLISKQRVLKLPKGRVPKLPKGRVPKSQTNNIQDRKIQNINTFQSIKTLIYSFGNITNIDYCKKSLHPLMGKCVCIFRTPSKGENIFAPILQEPFSEEILYEVTRNSCFSPCKIEESQSVDVNNFNANNANNICNEEMLFPNRDDLFDV